MNKEDHASKVQKTTSWSSLSKTSFKHLAGGDQCAMSEYGRVLRYRAFLYKKKQDTAKLLQHLLLLHFV